MRLPVTTTGMTLIAGSLEPVIDFETKRQRADQNGELLFAIDVVALTDDGPQIWPVRVAGEPKGIATGQPVVVHDLIAVPWEIDGRHGISFRASKIEAASKPSSATKAAA